MADPTEIRILCAGGNWMRIGALLALGMDGYYSKLPKGSTVAAVTGDPGSSCNDAPRLVAEGKYHMAITTPIFYGQMAGEGRGLFDEKLPLRALAAFPHDDRLIMAVREETGITSLRDLVDRQAPLKVSTPPPASRHPAAAVANDVLKAYWAALAIEALEEQHENMQSMFAEGAGLTGTIDLRQSCRNTGLPLHPGAERFYREHNYLS